MIQKKVRFKERQKKLKQLEEADKVDVESSGTSGGPIKSRRFKANHSMDSDEEDVEEGDKGGSGSNMLDEEEMEGQEDETIRHDEGITVTPFNLKDELEEGHFDAQGNYIPKKDADATDQWLDSADWDNVENQFQSKKRKEKQREKEEQEEEEPVRPVFRIMEDMMGIMKPGENVLKSLRRLGGNKKPMSSADRWKKKKQMKVEEEEVKDEKEIENAANLLKLTGLADELLQRGDFQIYEKTYEKLKFEIRDKQSQFDDAEDESDEIVCKKARLEEGATTTAETDTDKGGDEDADDDDDELEAAFKSTTTPDTNTENDQLHNGKRKLASGKHRLEPASVPKKETSPVRFDDEVSWTYRLEENGDGEEFGPFTSTEMLKMQEEGKFGSGVFCHKVGSEGSCYNSNRIDFDLYT